MTAPDYRLSFCASWQGPSDRCSLERRQLLCELLTTSDVLAYSAALQLRRVSSKPLLLHMPYSLWHTACCHPSGYRNALGEGSMPNQHV